MDENLNIPYGIHPVFRNKIQEVSETLVDNARILCMTQLWLFGSVARGDYSANSDIDLLVLTSSSSERAISVKVELLELRNDVDYPNVDIIVRNKSSLENDANFIFNNAVKRDKIVIWSDDNG